MLTSARLTRYGPRVPIPTIDLPPSNADKVLKRTAFTALNDALQKHGCCFLQGHGISQEVLRQSFVQSQRFFNLPSAMKQACRPAAQPLAQGYFALQGEQIRGQLCNKENFDCYSRKNDNLNSWPAGEPDFQSGCEKLHQAFLEVQDYLLEGLEYVLTKQLSEEMLNSHDGTMSLLSFNRYPPISVDEHQRDEEIRSPAHTDLSTLTLLLQNDVGGLQVADMDSTDETSSKNVDQHAAFWDVDPNPNSLLLITGFYSTLWPLGWRGSVHRVVTPPLRKNCERLSIVYFITPSTKTEIKYKRGDKDRVLNVGAHIRKKRGEIH